MTQVNLIKALIQCDFPPIVKSRTNPHYKSKYADLETINDVIKPVLRQNGLCIVQYTALTDNNRTSLCTTLYHESGECLESWWLLPDVTDPQKIGSALTYYRRYAICAMLNLSAEDDDAQAAKLEVRKTELLRQAKELGESLSLTAQERMNIILQEFGKDSASKMTVEELEVLVAYLQDKADKQGGASN
jgi:hypothetical protein